MPAVEKSNSVSAPLSEEGHLEDSTQMTPDCVSSGTVTVATGGSLWGLLSFQEKR